MQTDMDEVLHMKLEGPLAKLLTKVNPELYSKCVEIENGKTVMYVKLENGTVRNFASGATVLEGP
jgi:hypothetical protein